MIRKPADIIGKKTISVIIYGQSGAGKTALACSAPSPVLFDFDNGVSRLDYGLECDTVQLTTLDEAFIALQDVAKAGEYKTVIVDTLSKLVDKATSKQCGTRIPQVRDWQVIYYECKRFITAATELGLNLVFVAQDKEVKKSGKDDNYHRPDCPEKVYSTLKADVDIIGYMYYSADGGVEKRTITFNPTTGEITVEGAKVSNPEYVLNTVSVVGAGEGGFLDDESWNLNANPMTEVEDGLYEISFTEVDPNTEYQFKFAANGGWDINWGLVKDTEAKLNEANPSQYNGENILFNVESEGTLSYLCLEGYRPCAARPC